MAPLPTKEGQTKFQQVVRMYESKSYKKGVKLADQLLKKFPGHAETVSMKALILYQMDKREEAHALSKQALHFDIKSSTCWHVLGLLHKGDRNYDEALKAFKNANRMEKDSIIILRDLSLLQVHLRDLEGFRQTRHLILNLKSNVKLNWIMLAVAQYLLGQYDLALNTINLYENTEVPEVIDEKIKDPDGFPPQRNYERSEIAMFKVQILEEAGRFDEALQMLNSKESIVNDKRVWKEVKARLLTKLKDKAGALAIHRTLFADNENNVKYLLAIEEASATPIDSSRIPASKEIEKKMQEFYSTLTDSYPRSLLLKRRPLNFLSGDEFELHFRQYIQKRLRKGVPTVFNDVKPLYNNAAKVKIIEKVMLEFYENLKTHRSFSSVVDEPKEASDVLLWTTFFLAAHYDRLGRTDLALQHIDAAIAHTPTFVDLYMAKGKIFKHAGDLNKAAENMVLACELDTADRYLNSKCIKYLFRADKMDEAVQTAKFFIRQGVDHLEQLAELQCIWFETERGQSFQRMKKYGQALKQYHLIEKHFTDMYEDQLDFHQYCFRKMNIRAYVDLIKMEDKIRGHPYYFKAAKSAIQTYITLFDEPRNKEDEQFAGMDESERKKLLSKQRKQQAKEKEKAQQEAAAAAASSKSKSDKPGTNNSTTATKDEDPNGEKLASTEKPLEDALKFLTPLQQYSSQLVETNILAYDVHSRRGKYLLSLQALKRGIAADANNPDIHKRIVELSLKVAASPHANATVQEVLTKELSKLAGGKSLASLNEDFLAKNSKSLPHLLCGSEAHLMIHPSEKSHGIKLLSNLLDPELTGKSIELLTKVEISLSKLFGDKQAAEHTAEQCKKLYPYAQRWAAPEPAEQSEKKKDEEQVKAME